MNIAQKYVDGLKEAYYENGGEKQWNNFEKVMHGASKEDMEKLQVLYPDIPDSLLQLLEMIDGTYWRKYGEEEVALFFLGSDMDEYPYYLLSAQQMMDPEELVVIADSFDAYLQMLMEEEYDFITEDNIGEGE